jgi:hypothetical protein
MWTFELRIKQGSPLIKIGVPRNDVNAHGLLEAAIRQYTNFHTPPLKYHFKLHANGATARPTTNSPQVSSSSLLNCVRTVLNESLASYQETEAVVIAANSDEVTVEAEIEEVVNTSYPTLPSKGYVTWPKVAVSRLIGRNGAVFHQLEHDLRVRLDYNDGKVMITAHDDNALQRATEYLLTFRDSIIAQFHGYNHVRFVKVQPTDKVTKSTMHFDHLVYTTFRPFAFGHITGLGGIIKHALQDLYKVRLHFDLASHVATITALTESDADAGEREVRLLLAHGGNCKNKYSLERGNKYSLERGLEMAKATCVWPKTAQFSDKKAISLKAGGIFAVHFVGTPLIERPTEGRFASPASGILSKLPLPLFTEEEEEEKAVDSEIDSYGNSGLVLDSRTEQEQFVAIAAPTTLELTTAFDFLTSKTSLSWIKWLSIC